MQISPARRAAFEILQRVEEESAYSSALLAATNDELNEKDRALCHELVLGVLRRRLWLDRCIQHFGARQIERLDLPVTLALRLGLYQLRFLTRIPPSAAVNESVNLVRRAKLKSAAAFVNAVLRRATRERDFDPAADIDHPIERLAVETSHPDWLVESWITQFGFENAAALARANNNPAPLAFRLTAKALSERRADEVISQLRGAGAELRPSSIARNGWRVVRAENEPQSGGEDAGEPRAKISTLQFPALLRKLSADGLIYFQDEGSQMVAHLLGVQDGERILDACAAPGSKATLLAALASNAIIVAGDLYEHRARTINEFAIQQKAQNVRPITYDATRNLPFSEGSFDRVLVDAPCSGTGTFRHNPEIRWRLQLSDIAELSAKQRTILSNAAAMVRPGGTLVYSTCSLETEENEAVINDFRQRHPDFETSALDVPAGLSTDKETVRTWPHQNDMDGFFLAAFRRKS
jgi:16S rRNA (cytosine967-C5)-methyltransferase